MAATLATLAFAGAAPFLLAGEKSFFHLPGAEDFRFQTIARADNERDWPFAVGEGYLACVYVMGQRQVFFIGKDADVRYDPRIDPRTVAISNDPFALSFGNLGKSGMFVPYGGLEELMRRVAPFVAAGQRLCDQPRGSALGPGEL